MPLFDLRAGIQSGARDAYNEIASLRKQSKIAQLFGDAYKAPEQRSSILEQIARIDPASASLAEQQFQKRDALDRENLTRDARIASGLYRNANTDQAQTMYSALRDRASRMLGGAQLPQELDQGTASLLTMLGGGGKATNPYDGLPSDIQSLQLLQDNPQLLALDKERRQAARMVPQLAQTDQGYGWATPNSGIQLAPITGVAGGRQPAEAPQLFAALSQKYGIQPTSVQRTQQHNREVGGVANSYHLSGQAADYVVPPQAKAQFIQDAQSNGFEAIDEGDHIHIEPAGQRGGPQSIAQPYRAPQRAVETMSPAQVAAAGLPPGTVAQRSENGEITVVSKPSDVTASGAKPIPVGALNPILAAQDALGATQAVSDIIIKHSQRMKDGKLQLYPEDAIGAKARTALGRTNANDVNVNEYRADMTRIVNESLRLNKGVQTEGDAQRAAQELMAANDNKTAARAMQRLAGLNQRAVQLQRQKLRTIYGNYGRNENGDPNQAPAQQSTGGVLRYNPATGDFE